jgi:hypothetical protein
MLSEAPYTEMEPAPELIVNGNPLITALAKRGSYYLFHFGQTKEPADWNIGFFGPATPSQPLPRPDGPVRWPPSRVPEFHIGEGTFRVDMIDTWNMKTYFLGYTTGPVQRFQPEIAPGVMRFVKVQQPEPGTRPAAVTDLLNEFGSRPR